jgi:hypothetical protein
MSLGIRKISRNTTNLRDANHRHFTCRPRFARRVRASIPPVRRSNCSVDTHAWTNKLTGICIIRQAASCFSREHLSPPQRHVRHNTASESTAKLKELASIEHSDLLMLAVRSWDLLQYRKDWRKTTNACYCNVMQSLPHWQHSAKGVSSEHPHRPDQKIPRPSY